MPKTNLKRIMIIALSTAAVGTCIVYMIYPRWKAFPDWAEAKSMAGNIGEALRVYSELKGRNGNYPPSWQDLGFEVDYIFEAEDTYFKEECYSWEAAYDANLTPPVRFKITVIPPEGRKTEHISMYKKITYNHEGVFEEFE